VSGHAGHRKRLLCLTGAACRAGRLSLAGNLDFFPADSIARRGSKSSRTRVRLDVEGLLEPVHTSIQGLTASGRSTNRFVEQSWIRPFLKLHGLGPGDTIAIERVSTHRYRVGPFDAKSGQGGQSSLETLRITPVSGPSVIELFAGCGGMALGFVRAGFETVLANEWDRAASDSLRANITQRVLNCPIQEVGTFPKADVVAGGPPCQGFSNLGERVPNDPRNQLWRHFFRCVRDAEPKLFVLENVPPLLKSAEFEEMQRMAMRLGYEVVSGVLNAADYGVPQARKRAIVIGSRVGKPSLPEPTHVDPRRVNLLSSGLPHWRTVRDAIGHLPIHPDGLNWHIGRNPTAKSLERYKAIPPGGNRWNLPAHLMPDCWKRKVSGGTDLFGRLWWDRPSVTIRTEFYKPEKGRYLHPVANRPITHLEAALLQSFPVDYQFCGSKIQVGVQIGNAVPPILAHQIAQHALRMISGTVPGRVISAGG
jgi:DNA (cytosine-5)-methyltransferase 1